MDKIEVEEPETTADRPGEVLINAIIGNANEFFEIRYEGACVTYWVGSLNVSREIYLDCLATLEKDRSVYPPESASFNG